MAFTTGVAGVVGALGEVIEATDTGIQLLYLLLGLMCGLIHEEDVHFSALEAICIFGLVAVSEQDSALVLESDVLLTVIVGGQPVIPVRCIAVQHLTQRNYVVLLKLWVGLTDDHDLDARIVQAQQNSLDTDRPALATTSGSTEGNVGVISSEE